MTDNKLVNPVKKANRFQRLKSIERQLVLVLKKPTKTFMPINHYSFTYPSINELSCAELIPDHQSNQLTTLASFLLPQERSRSAKGCTMEFVFQREN
jgi:hypothetical protein